jgi:hypothetical protein
MMITQGRSLRRSLLEVGKRVITIWVIYEKPLEQMVACLLHAREVQSKENAQMSMIFQNALAEELVICFRECFDDAD